MNEIVMRLKSGREFRFKCEEYTIKTFKPTGTLSDFSYKGGVGECPIYYQAQDIECIAIIGKEQIEELEQEPCKVVRCRECEYWKCNPNTKNYGVCGKVSYDDFEVIMERDDFCSYGICIK